MPKLRCRYEITGPLDENEDAGALTGGRMKIRKFHASARHRANGIRMKVDRLRPNEPSDIRALVPARSQPWFGTRENTLLMRNVAFARSDTLQWVSHRTERR